MASVCDKVPLCDWNVIQLRPSTTQPSATLCHASTTRQPTTLAAVLDQSKEEHFVGSVVGKLLLEEVGDRAANLQGLNQCTQSYRAPVSSGLRLCTSGDLVCPHAHLNISPYFHFTGQKARCPLSAHYHCPC